MLYKKWSNSVVFGRQLGSVILAEATDCHGLSQGLPELTAKVHHACFRLIGCSTTYLRCTFCYYAYQQCRSTESFNLQIFQNGCVCVCFNFAYSNTNAAVCLMCLCLVFILTHWPVDQVLGDIPKKSQENRKPLMILERFCLKCK